MAGALVGERIAEVDRRGKYLLVRLASGRTLVVHLRMTGRSATRRRAGFPRTRTAGRRSGWTRASDVAYRDVRRFGTWELLERGRPAAVPRDPARPGAARRLVQRARGSRAARAGGRAPRQGVPPRPAAHRRASGTSTPTRRSGAPGCIRAARRASSTRTSSRGCTARCGRRCGRGSSARARRCATTSRPTGRRRDAGRVPRLRPSRRAVRPLRQRRSSGSSSAAAARGSARTASSALDRRAPLVHSRPMRPHSIDHGEAVVLRSFAFGEADRVLHVYTAASGRLGAVAKGVRRTKSRFGGRLEPFSHVELSLHRGRGELATVTGASLVRSHDRVRSDATGSRSGSSGSRRCCGCSPRRSRTSVRSSR